MTAFEGELLKLLQIKDKLLTAETMSDATNLAGLDSLGLTELCILFEEHFHIEVTFEKMKTMKIVGDLCRLIPRSDASQMCGAHGVETNVCGCDPTGEHHD